MISPKRILLVEDDLFHKELIFRAFEDSNDMVILWAETLSEAQRLIRESKLDLVISDWRLTDGSGIDLILSSHSVLPIILMTSFGNEELAVQSMKAGVMDYLVKSPEAFEKLPQNARRALREWDNVISRQEAEKALEKLAFFDPIRGLPNRIQFTQKLNQHITQGGNLCSGLLFFIDVDNFKVINDTFGHSWGDRCLLEVGKRLDNLNIPQQFLCRIGGDEFIMMVDEVVEPRDAVTFAKQIIECFQIPLVIDENKFYLTVSIGIASYPRDGMTVDELLKNADAAMYESKAKGRNTYTMFDKSISQSIYEKMDMGNHLRTAIGNDEFLLYYQPQFEISSGNICGLEALIRWENSHLGFVSPLRFIKLAEEMGLIVPIGYWVIRQACSFGASLHEKYPNLHISINLSSVQLMQSDFVDQVKNIIEQAGIPPSMIRLEITESMLMESFDSSVKKLIMLKKFGVKIELDDFGTGYSSLNYLKGLPIHTVKIDKTFIDDIAGQQRDMNITDLIVRIAHKLGLKVVAEGVETKEQMDILAQYKCDVIQGFFISRPLPENQVGSFLESYIK